jgi:hypothetical protein
MTFKSFIFKILLTVTGLAPFQCLQGVGLAMMEITTLRHREPWFVQGVAICSHGKKVRFILYLGLPRPAGIGLAMTARINIQSQSVHRALAVTKRGAGGCCECRKAWNFNKRACVRLLEIPDFRQSGRGLFCPACHAGAWLGRQA